MHLALIILAVVIWVTLIVLWLRRKWEERQFARISITPEALYDRIVNKQDLAILDVRQPLDLLTDSEIIEGAIRISPQDAERDPSLVPAGKELVVYCTCPSDKTSRAIALKASNLTSDIDFSRVKFLKGGLAAWKAKGYPVVPYDKTFHLDTGT